MHVIAFKTTPVKPYDNMDDFLRAHVPPLQEGSVLAITSKILSLCQGRIISKEEVSKADLIAQEADRIADIKDHPYGLTITIKNNLLLASAGIDESNGDGAYILYPEHLQETTNHIWTLLRARDTIQHLGVIVTDSHTTPFRMGVTGLALSYCGFMPLYSYVNEPDIFGRLLRVTQINLLDALATAAVYVMGEGAECTPLAHITEAPKIEFLDRAPSLSELQSVIVPLENDLYAPLWQGIQWLKPRG